MSRLYDFETQLAKGEESEENLDSFFIEKYNVTVEKVDLELQKKGVDRIFTFPNGQRFKIEYKTDSITHKTGNVFMETISNSSNGALGWVYKTTCDLIVYYVPGYSKLAITKPSKIIEKMRDWIFTYQTRACRNPGYQSFGILLPWSEFTKYSERVLDIVAPETSN